MNGWSEFFHMGGYALYVWGSYGVTALLLGWEVAAVWRKRSATLRTLREAPPTPAEETNP